jgi:hypothetical protein
VVSPARRELDSRLRSKAARRSRLMAQSGAPALAGPPAETGLQRPRHTEGRLQEETEGPYPAERGVAAAAHAGGASLTRRATAGAGSLLPPRPPGVFIRRHGTLYLGGSQAHRVSLLSRPRPRINREADTVRTL